MNQKQVMTRDSFNQLFEPKISELVKLGQYGDAMYQFAQVLRTYDVEQNFRAELIFGYSICKIKFTEKFLAEQKALSDQLAQDIAITPEEQQTVAAMVVGWGKALQQAKQEAQDGQAQ